MLYHCDALLPIVERYSSDKFRRLSRWFDPYKQDKVHLLELTIFCLTPGISLPHIGFMMQWDSNMLPMMQHEVIPHYQPEAVHYVPDNAASITELDGFYMFRAILDGNPTRGGSMPLYVTRYLQARRQRGATVASLAREFNVPRHRIQRWWTANRYDPFTGVERPAHTMANHKPSRSRYRPTV